MNNKMNTCIKKAYRIIPRSIRNRVAPPLSRVWSAFLWRKRKIYNGPENSDKTFYVIRYMFSGGLFGLMGYYIPQIEYAYSKGYIPIIDLQNYNNMYIERDDFGKKNAWEYYFLQPAGYNLDDINNSSNIILSNGGLGATEKNKLAELIYDKKRIKQWHDIYTKSIIMNSHTKMYCEKQYNSLISKEDTVLGVLSRGTDYINNKPKNHTAQPEVEDIIQKAAEFKRKYRCNKVFLATEDKRIWEAFRNEFGECLITNDHELIENTGGRFLTEIEPKREKGAYLRGLEYLATIYILSKCKYLVAGNCGGSQAAMYMTEGYVDSYIFNLGVYQ